MTTALLPGGSTVDYTNTEGDNQKNMIDKQKGKP